MANNVKGFIHARIMYGTNRLYNDLLFCFPADADDFLAEEEEEDIMATFTLLFTCADLALWTFCFVEDDKRFVLVTIGSSSTFSSSESYSSSFPPPPRT